MGVVLSSCCYNIVYSAVTGWSGFTTPGLVFSVTGNSNIPIGCYTIVTGVTGQVINFSGTAQGVTGCTAPSCLECCPDEFCISISSGIYSGYSGTYTVNGGHNYYPDRRYI